MARCRNNHVYSVRQTGQPWRAMWHFLSQSKGWNLIILAWLLNKTELWLPFTMSRRSSSSCELNSSENGPSFKKKKMEAADTQNNTFLFTSESVGEGHPGILLESCVASYPLLFYFLEFESEANFLMSFCLFLKQTKSAIKFLMQFSMPIWSKIPMQKLLVVSFRRELKMNSKEIFFFLWILKNDWLPGAYPLYTRMSKNVRNSFLQHLLVLMQHAARFVMWELKIWFWKQNDKVLYCWKFLMQTRHWPALRNQCTALVWYALIIVKRRCLPDVLSDLLIFFKTSLDKVASCELPYTK